MITTIEEPEIKFKPFVLNIIFEAQSEVDAFYDIIDESENVDKMVYLIKGTLAPKTSMKINGQ